MLVCHVDTLLYIFPHENILSFSLALSLLPPAQKKSVEVNLQTALENLEVLEDILKVSVTAT